MACACAVLLPVCAALCEQVDVRYGGRLSFRESCVDIHPVAFSSSGWKQIDGTGETRPSAAGSVPKKLRQPGAGGRQVDHLIRNAASVREALVKARDFTGATNVILADRHEVAFIEVLPGGTVLHKATSHGTLAHTNHYVLPESEPHNGKIAQTSLRRYERIRELLAASPRPMNLESFEAMIRDRNDGPDNSIWRTGTETSRHRTISASAAQFMPDGSVRFFITYRPSGNEDFVTVRTTVRPEDFRK